MSTADHVTHPGKGSFGIDGLVVDVVGGEIFRGTVEVRDGRIAGVTRGGAGVGQDRYLTPGLVDAHIHIESSMLVPSQFARLAAAHGTVGVVSDPHEIANVLGVKGVEFMIRDGARVPFHFAFGAPSCVPATPFESTGARLGPEEVERLLARPEILYLSEVMNYPGVVHNDPEIAAKLKAAARYGKPIDGHAPGLRGADLSAYAGAGICTDHESLSYEEAEEKLRLGMKILIREGSAARDFDMLVPLMQHFPDQCMLCSDDLHPHDLVRGHINRLVTRAIAAGVDPIVALRCASLIPARHYGLDMGLLQPGDPADFLVVDDLRDFSPAQTYVGGELVAVDGVPLFRVEPPHTPNCFVAAEQAPQAFHVQARGSHINVIEALEGQLFTQKLVLRPTVRDGLAVADADRDLLKIAVLNRYQAAPPAVGFIRNFGLRSGAMASSVAHDSHNVVAVGTSDDELTEAINAVVRMKGGLAVTAAGRTVSLALPVAGLMSPEDGLSVAEAYAALDAAAKDLGSPLSAPFMTLSFMALLVIPRLKMSDIGLFDSEAFRAVDLFVN